MDRSGTADRILEAKEKQREQEKTNRAKKRAKRYCIHISSNSSFIPIGPPPPYVLRALRSYGHLLTKCSYQFIKRVCLQFRVRIRVRNVVVRLWF
jgi:hypothetical protein